MNLRDKTIVIDVDEVLLDTHKHFIECLVNEFGNNSDRYDILDQEWEMNTVLTDEEADFIWGEKGYRSPDFHSTLVFKDGAVETVQKIIDNSLETFIISDCPIEVQAVRKAAMNKVFPTACVYFTHHVNSQSNSAAKTKTELIEHLMKDRNNKAVVFEDSPFHITEMLQSKSVANIVVFSMPYNRKLQNEKLLRVSSWQDVQEIIS